jgi:hypothetical protein
MEKSSSLLPILQSQTTILWKLLITYLLYTVNSSIRVTRFGYTGYDHLQAG